MSQIIVDEAFLAKTQGGQQTVELCDATGRVLGRYLPEDKYARMVDDLEWAKPLHEAVRKEALAELAAGKCSTTEEVLDEMDEMERGWEKTK